MRPFALHAAIIVVAHLTLTACSDESSASPSSSSSESSPTNVDRAALYVGHWTWQAGSRTVVSCPGRDDVITNLATASPNNTPAWFEITRKDDGQNLEEVDVLGCHFDLEVGPSSATAVAGQSCDKFPDGKGGTMTATTESAVKTTLDGHSLNAHAVDSINGAPCTMTVDGTAMK